MDKNDISTQKKELRKRILALRDALPQDERRKKSISIHKHLFSLPEFTNAKTVAFFVSFRSEVLTEQMIREALSLGKSVVVPITDLAGKRLIFSRLNDYNTDLSPGTWGILEPKAECVRPVAPEKIDIVITPGAVFDYRGGRIGYGGGFYDRLLKTFHNPSIALAFAIQIVDRVPVDPDHDIPIDIIITEEGIVRCKSGISQTC